MFQNRCIKWPSPYTSGMLRKIRQAVTGLVEQEREEESWDLEPGVGYDPTLQVQDSPTFLQEEPPTAGTFDPEAGPDYQTTLVRASIEGGGKSGRYVIPVWWLRAILADLEGRRSEAELIWGRSEQAGEAFEDRSTMDGDPLYDSLFTG